MVKLAMLCDNDPSCETLHRVAIDPSAHDIIPIR